MKIIDVPTSSYRQREVRAFRALTVIADTDEVVVRVQVFTTPMPVSTQTLLLTREEAAALGAVLVGLASAGPEDPVVDPVATYDGEAAS